LKVAAAAVKPTGFGVPLAPPGQIRALAPAKSIPIAPV